MFFKTIIQYSSISPARERLILWPGWEEAGKPCLAGVRENDRFKKNLKKNIKKNANKHQNFDFIKGTFFHMTYLMVAIGGAGGAVLRYGLSGWVQSFSSGGFPYGTLAVNVVGSFLIGLVMQLSLDRFMVSLEVRLLLTTGFCGGLTTFSTFSYETLSLVEGGQFAQAGGNIALNVALTLLATYLGLVFARVI